MLMRHRQHNCFFLLMAVMLSVNAELSFAAKPSYEQYINLEPAQKNTLVRKYVKQDSQGYWTVSAFKYLVRTKLSAREALETALIMDKFYDDVSDIFGSRFHDSLQTELYLFADKTSYTAFLALKDIDANFSSGMYVPGEHMLAVCGDDDEASRRKTLFHESTHQLLHAYTVKKSLPVWFNEGMATNLETWDVTLSKAENLQLAIVRSNLRSIAIMAALSGKSYSLKQLLAIKSEEWLSASDPALNYAMAWSFTNFMLSSPERSAMLDRILESVRKGYNLEKILSPAMVKNLDAKWHEDQKTRLVLYEKYIVPALELAEQKKTGPAIGILQQGIAEFPNLSDGRIYRGNLCFEEKQFAEARKEFETIEKNDPDFPEINLLLAKTCLAMDDLDSAKKYVQVFLKQDRKNLTGRDLMRQIGQRLRKKQEQAKEAETQHEQTNPQS